MSARVETASFRASGEWPGGKVSRASPVQACRGNRHGDRIPVLVMCVRGVHHQSEQGEIPQDVGLLAALAQKPMVGEGKDKSAVLGVEVSRVGAPV